MASDWKVCFIIQFYHSSKGQIVLESRGNFIDLSLMLCINLAMNSLSSSSYSLYIAYNYFPGIACKRFQMHLSLGNLKALGTYFWCVFQWLWLRGSVTLMKSSQFIYCHLKNVENFNFLFNEPDSFLYLFFFLFYIAFSKPIPLI